MIHFSRYLYRNIEEEEKNGTKNVIAKRNILSKQSQNG